METRLGGNFIRNQPTSSDIDLMTVYCNVDTFLRFFALGLNPNGITFETLQSDQQVENIARIYATCLPIALRVWNEVSVNVRQSGRKVG